MSPVPTEVRTELRERRLLVHAPVGRDAVLMSDMLARDAIECTVCPDIGTLAHEAEHGAAAVLVTEEGLADNEQPLATLIGNQPPWSDLPVLVLTKPGADSPEVQQALRWLGNVTLLERPVRVAALVTAVRSALRARARQYEIRAHLREREDADRRKDEFLAMLAHELRNPLAPIRNSVSILRMAGAEHLAPRLGSMIDRQVTHMVRLVDDLMEVSRVTRGKIVLRKEMLDLRSVIEAAVEASRPMAENAGHTVAVTLPPAPMPVHGDLVRLTQVFANLLNNAIKYTDGGGRIAVHAAADARSAAVTVEDSGIGIEPALLPHVFDMFVQGKPDQDRAQSGLGIGLTLVRSLVALHDGEVAAASAGPGQGSRFTVRLPLAGAPAVSRPEAPADAGAQARRAPRVLVVDDNTDAAESLGELLQLLGADVRVAHDGAAALQAFEEFRPAVLFLDLGMAGLSGYDVARQLRQHAEGRGVTLIALTGWGRHEDRERTRAAGFDGHLVKPADVPTLQSVLASLSG